MAKPKGTGLYHKVSFIGCFRYNLTIYVYIRAKENIKIYLCDFELGNSFLNMTLKTEAAKYHWATSKLKMVLETIPSRKCKTIHRMRENDCKAHI